MRVDFKELEDYLLEYGYPKNEMMDKEYFDIPEMTSYQYLMSNIRKFYNRNAMVYYGNRISYSRFSKEITSAGKILQYIGGKKYDRVAVLMPNIPEAAYLQYGASKIGMVVSNIDPRTSSQQLIKYVEKEKIKQIAIVDVLYAHAIRPIEHELKHIFGISQIIVVPATNSAGKLVKAIVKIKGGYKTQIDSEIVKVSYWNELKKESFEVDIDTIPYEPNQIAVIEHSSGTSKGVSKSIPLTNENINSFVEKHRPTVFNDLESGTTMLHLLPYFAAYGAINSAHLGFNFGLTLQEIPEFDFKDFGYLAYKNKSQVIIGVPNWFSMAAKDERLKYKNLSFIKMAISGGDSNNPKDKEIEDNFLKNHGAKCLETNGHGMSELCGSASYQFPGHENGLGIGIPFPYDKYIVLDDNHEIVPLGKNGVIGTAYIYSPSATSGIFEDERFAETVEINGFRFLNSKDTIHIYPNYEMLYIGREDRNFTRFDGYKVVPTNIETLITEHKCIKQCLVVPYEDDIVGGKVPIAYMVSVEEISNDEKLKIIETLVEYLMVHDGITERDLPYKFCFIDDLPVNLMNKKDYLALEKRKLDGSEYTLQIKESNLKVGAFSIIEPKIYERS